MKKLLQQKSFLFDKTVAISFAKKWFLYGMIRWSVIFPIA